MILINNEWYNPKDLSDISNIIRENFSYDLSHKMDELIQSENDGKVYDLECQIDDLNNEIGSLEDDINDRDNEICELKEEIDELNEKIRELEEINEI